MNLNERETILFSIEELEKLVLGDLIYTEEFYKIQKMRRSAITNRE